MDQPTNKPHSPETAVEPMSVVVKIDSSVDFSARQSGQETVYVANDPRTGKFYRFGAREYHVVSLMDGNRSLNQVVDQLEKDGLLWTQADVIAFVRELTQHRLVVVVPRSRTSEKVNSQQDVAASSYGEAKPIVNTTPPKLTRVFGWVLRICAGMLTQRFPLVQGDRIAIKLLPLIGPLFSGPANVAWCVLVASGVGVVWSNADAFSLEVRRVFDQQLWLVLAFIWCVLKLVHECGHAVCAKRHGARVGPMGVMLFLFAPLAYVDVTDAWKLVRRRDRVQIALAGVHLELAIGAIAALVWWGCSPGFAKHLAAQIFLVAGPATLLVNANPLLRLDGYYVLSDLLEIPNLRAHGRARLAALVEKVFFQIPLPSSPLSGWRLSFASAHAFCSVIFQVVWMFGLIIAIAAWAKGLGVVVAIAAGFMWGVLPLTKWMHKIWTIQSNESWILTVYQRRLIAFSTAVVLLIQYATVTSSPFARRVPVVVRFQDEQIARATSDAFVTSVYVRCGERVEAGRLLMELDQPDLILKRDQLFDQQEVEFSKAIQYRQRGEVALSRAAQHHAESIARKLTEIQTQIDSLRVVATRNGHVTSPATDRLLGSFVSRGDELIRVSDPQEKELLAIVAEDNLQAYKQASSAGRTASVRLKGGVSISARLTDVQPSASRALPHPALAATAGGPLAVQMLDQSDSTELVSPQLRSVVHLDPLTSLMVKSGQIGRLTIPDDRTLVSRLWDEIQTR